MIWNYILINIIKNINKMQKVNIIKNKKMINTRIVIVMSNNNLYWRINNVNKKLLK